MIKSDDFIDSAEFNADKLSLKSQIQIFFCVLKTKKRTVGSSPSSVLK